MAKTQLDHLVEMSNRYGGNPEYVLAGGGNTSYKDEKHLYVKASGTALADITAEGFVKMDRAALDRIFEREYPEDAQAREADVLNDMLAACCDDTQAGTGSSEANEGLQNSPGDCFSQVRLSAPRRRRPSVEALLHHILPGAYALHIHPAMVNGMTCGNFGVQACASLFSGAVWIEQIMPGYILAKEALSRIEPDTRMLFLENHGVFIGGQSVEEIDDTVARMNGILEAVIRRTPDFALCEYDSIKAARFATAVQALATKDGACVFHTNREAAEALTSRELFARVNPALTPDHMVYCNDKALFIENEGELAAKLADYQARNSKVPKIIGLKDIGLYACGSNEKEANIAMAVFLDALKIFVYGESFGGAQPMCEELVREINNWEVERYRKSVSFGKA